VSLPIRNTVVEALLRDMMKRDLMKRFCWICELRKELEKLVEVLLVITTVERRRKWWLLWWLVVVMRWLMELVDLPERERERKRVDGGCCVG